MALFFSQCRRGWGPRNVGGSAGEVVLSGRLQYTEKKREPKWEAMG